MSGFLQELSDIEMLNELIIDIETLREKHNITYETLLKIVTVMSVYPWEIEVRGSKSHKEDINE